MTDQRPNPDELLERVQREQAKARHGKLKVFFGASPGVGKTYAMLSAARQCRAQGLDVVVGIAETHGRAETQALLDGLEVVPLKEIEYRGRTLREFDLDGALKRRPALILVDELAHSNVQGSRHAKRWQDVQELLASGIDVWTTLNVQHLESLNDVIGSITGIRVWERLPDKVFDQSDEVVLVDITPDELLQRLHDGKVYIPEQAREAIQNFFRKGNLIALRELSLRRTADRVDDQMRLYRKERSIEDVWQTREALLVCVGPEAGIEKVIRAAGRLAAQMEAPWHAVYIETPELQRLPAAERERILQALRLAHEMGAQTATLAGKDAAQVLVDYARQRNLTKFVVGRAYRGKRPWRRSFADRIGRLSGDMDVLQVVRDVTGERGATPRLAWYYQELPRFRPRRYAWAALACMITTLLATPALPYLDPANIVMVFLLTVVLVAMKLGRGPAVLAAFLSVAMFDYFFVPPRFTLAVSDAQYLVTFFVMLAVGLIIGHLTADLRFQARVGNRREERLRSLYEMARDLSSVLLPEQIVEISRKYIEGSFGVRAALLLTNERDKLQPPEFSGLSVDLGVAQWAFDHSQPAGFGTSTLPGNPLFYLPLRAPMRMRGVLAIEPSDARWLLIPEQRRQLDGFAALIATALERVHYIEVAQDSLVKIESERLRNSVLSILSHDLRTPLTVLVGTADSLSRSKPPLGEAQLELATTIRDEAYRMNALVDNLLHMARLQAGEVKLNRCWQPLEEVIGSAIKAREQLLSNHAVTVSLPPDLPALEFDSVLVERVFCNLLENAAKYTSPGSTIEIGAHIEGAEAHISVTDNGPGLAPGSEEAIFEKFTRGERESTTLGVGLGLAICRAIVQAHKGRIWAENVPSGGARFTFTLPVGIPPTLADLPEENDLERRAATE
jgi:two-component system sensor histidine kinase KdpD